MAQLFIKYEEIADDDIKLLVAGTSMVLTQFYKYFEKIGIDLDETNFWSKPDGFNCLWNIHKKCKSVFDSRNLELPDELVRVKPQIPQNEDGI